MKLFRLPAIRIHGWGGLGSQLYTWALFEDLSVKFPKRKILILLHDATFTRRPSELGTFFDENVIKIISDYKPGSKNATFKKINDGNKKNKILGIRIKLKAKEMIINSLKTTLSATGIFATCDSTESFAKLKPWVLIIRGSYYNRFISTSTVDGILRRASNFGNPFQNYNGGNELICLHYRLGDLLTIGSKKPMDFEKIAILINEIGRKQNIKNLHIFSDSTETAISIAFEYFVNMEITGRELEIKNTINELIKAEIFIGTNSKITEWVAIFRAHSGLNPQSFVPKSMALHLRQSFEIVQKTSNINGY